MKPFELIAALMHKEGLGALPLAKKMNRPELQPSIHRFVRGVITNPVATTAAPLAKYFNLPLEAIYEEKVATKIGRERGLTVIQLPAVRVTRKKTASSDAVESDEALFEMAHRYAEMSPQARTKFDALIKQIGKSALTATTADMGGGTHFGANDDDRPFHFGTGPKEIFLSRPDELAVPKTKKKGNE